MHDIYCIVFRQTSMEGSGTTVPFYVFFCFIHFGIHIYLFNHQESNSDECNHVKMIFYYHFFAPIGAQGVTMSVRLSGTSLSKALQIFIILAQIFKQSVRNKSAVSQRALRASK